MPYLRIHSLLSTLKGLSPDLEEGSKRQEIGDVDFEPVLREGWGCR
jgi:hypothetical protein